ncbi:hypothetical protein M4D49_29060 [Cupriavidus pauculus]|uniref:hypothetical protein n=1 Tax=Cupriavidus TaxID=106589 RepID=UPI0009B8C568|nr:MULTISPECIES: hypothetical protein [Cupriavidus]MCM3609528.1 hypothetical protein [Cupriavidus pauculus]
MSTAASNSMIQRLTDAATDIFLGALKHTDHGGHFKGLFTLNVDGAPKPVLLVGSAHGSHEDGQVIAVLNPDREVIDRLAPGVAYLGALLKEIVAGKCDAMVQVWIDAYKADRFTVLEKYSARASADSKFDVK